MRKIKTNSINARRGSSGKIVLVIAGILLATIFVFFTLYGIHTFFDTYRVQSPVVIRPLIIKREVKSKKIPKTKPTSRKLIKEVEASSSEASEATEALGDTIESFPKYLTDQGAKNRDITIAYLKEKGYSGDRLTAMDNIFKKESGYRADALNEIGAGGVCQAYPASKMPCELTDSNLICQVDWCTNYTNQRYGSPTQAWEWHESYNWF